jgi:hypothetical protein
LVGNSRNEEAKFTTKKFFSLPKLPSKNKWSLG